jgi:hypothetical protein
LLFQKGSRRLITLSSNQIPDTKLAWVLLHQNGEPIGVVGVAVPVVYMGSADSAFADAASNIFLGFGFGEGKLYHRTVHENGSKCFAIVKRFIYYYVEVSVSLKENYLKRWMQASHTLIKRSLYRLFFKPVRAAFLHATHRLSAHSSYTPVKNRCYKR